MWETLPLKINPVLADFGWFSLRWYSLAYLLALLTLFGLVNWRLNRQEIFFQKNPTEIKDRLWTIFLWSFLGMFLGAKLGFVIFYDWSNFLADPWSTLSPFSQGRWIGFFGLSFHGGLLGVLSASFWAARKAKLDWLKISDLISPAFPLAYFWGRLGNFFNGELFGKITDAPWGMYFPADPITLRHPSQLYEALGEGLLIFLILWPIRNQPAFRNQFLFFFLILYGLIRFTLEFFRQEPLFLFDLLTKGQFLCLIMVFVGLVGLKLRQAPMTNF